VSRTAPDLAALRPLVPAHSRAREVASRLSADIASGKLGPGSRLPTEHALMAALGVSRTVVREAVAALRSEGMVRTRQGVGAFVATDTQRQPFRIDPDGLRSLGDVVNLMELRTGIEVEAAGLAAERATALQIKEIANALREIDRAIARHEGAVDEDFGFHRRIADATNNPQFINFHDYLGRFIIPRQSVRVVAEPAAAQRDYLDLIQREHQRVYAAIRSHDVAAARAAMRSHLLNGRERYRKLATAKPR
jgi:GntR family transcriptional regulator, transcriptional repressor for pyruvate dehydrogenase complex